MAENDANEAAQAQQQPPQVQMNVLGQFVRDELGLGPRGFGLLLSASAIGSIVGGLVGSRHARPKEPGRQGGQRPKKKKRSHRRQSTLDGRRSSIPGRRLGERSRRASPGSDQRRRWVGSPGAVGRAAPGIGIGENIVECRVLSVRFASLSHHIPRVVVIVGVLPPPLRGGRRLSSGLDHIQPRSL